MADSVSARICSASSWRVLSKVQRHRICALRGHQRQVMYGWGCLCQRRRHGQGLSRNRACSCARASSLWPREFLSCRRPGQVPRAGRLLPGKGPAFQFLLCQSDLGPGSVGQLHCFSEKFSARFNFVLNAISPDRTSRRDDWLNSRIRLNFPWRPGCHRFR